MTNTGRGQYSGMKENAHNRQNTPDEQRRDRRIEREANAITWAIYTALALLLGYGLYQAFTTDTGQSDHDWRIKPQPNYPIDGSAR